MTINEKMKRYAECLLYEPFNSHEIRAIESICGGRDTFVVSASGDKKRGIVFVASLSGEKRPMLVIEPTISLIDESIRDLLALDEPISAASLTAYNREDHGELLKKWKKHKISILYVTPERLKKKYFLEAINEIEPWLIVIDECHRVQDWDEKFRSPYLEIKSLVKSLPHRPTMLAMTATAPPADREAIWNQLGLRNPEEIILSVDKPNLSIIVEEWNNPETGKGAPLEALLYRLKKIIFEYGNYGSTIIYAPTPHVVTTVADYLNVEFPGYVVMSHSKMPKEKRANNEWLFLSNTCRIMVTTKDGGQSIDKHDVRLVVHFGLPLSAVDYWQQIGRAGKNGEATYAVAIYNKKLMKVNDDLINSVPKDARKQMKKWKKEIESIFASDKCIKRSLLKALGEKSGRCGHCSACWEEEEKRKCVDSGAK